MKGLMMKTKLLCLLLCLSAFPVFAQDLKPEFMPLEAAQPILRGLPDSIPAELKSSMPLDAAKWLTWMQTRDRGIRDRVTQGEEDTLTNLLRLGVTFTKEYPITTEYMARYGESTLVNSFAENRASDLIRALAGPTKNAGILEMRELLERKGFTLKTPAGRQAVRKYLLANLARMRQDYLRSREAAKANRFQMFQDRGISTDSSLWPNFLIDQHLKHMVEKGLLKPGSVQRVAIVGPGLDFVNKNAGTDFYPPQTIQPFAVIDSLAKFGLADPAEIELYTFDISRRVNVHIDRARKSSALGKPYIVQLHWRPSEQWDAALNQEFTDYWSALGKQVGKAVTPASLPAKAGDLKVRAVAIRPAVVQSIVPVDMNVVFQRVMVTPEQQFDIIIGTDIFVYYGTLEQSLARANVATMLKPGGYLLSDDKLPSTVLSGLNDDLVTSVRISEGKPMESLFSYKRVK
jgi:hypothetical protein